MLVIDPRGQEKGRGCDLQSSLIFRSFGEIAAINAVAAAAGCVDLKNFILAIVLERRGRQGSEIECGTCRAANVKKMNMKSR
jgi:hypothetical protein